jgi:DNA-binding transcriptional regulator GbsR (MarR family)
MSWLKKGVKEIEEKLNLAKAYLMELLEDFEGLKDEQEEKICNIPDNLRYSEKVIKMETRLEGMEVLYSIVDSCIDGFDDIQEVIENIKEGV